MPGWRTQTTVRMFLAPGCLSQSPAGGGGEDNWFQGKQTTVRCFLLLYASANHQQEEEARRTGSKVRKQITVRMFLAPDCLRGEGEENWFQGKQATVICSCSWLPQRVTSRRRR
jgi:hypothetical protein